MPRSKQNLFMEGFENICMMHDFRGNWAIKQRSVQDTCTLQLNVMHVNDVNILHRLCVNRFASGLLIN